MVENAEYEPFTGAGAEERLDPFTAAGAEGKVDPFTGAGAEEISTT